MLLAKARDSGFETIVATPFGSIPVPLMLLRKLSQTRSPEDANSTELQPPALLNQSLRLVLGAERTLMKAGVSWPVGGSLIAGLRST